ncbi:MAG: zinc-binding dehydrogenase [Actinobacteria bacterium]|nr:zinc-binding dehydrogenase [Actinomycetota bacterium]
MRALRIDRNTGRFMIARLASGIDTGSAAKIGPLTLGEADAPALPGVGWQRVYPRLTGICGSDLATVEGHASTYFENWVSFPFVPGHEIVGELDSGERIVVEPVLGHAARGHALPFEGAAPGDGDDYAHLALPPLEPGIQIGFCNSTGGGWATELVAHESQIHRIPHDMSDERAVLIEPLAGGIHSALQAVESVRGVESPVIAVQGAGTMGLCAIAGLRTFAPHAHVVVGARYPAQVRAAKELGATTVVDASELARTVRHVVGCHIVGNYLSSGAHVTIDAVGNSESIGTSIHITRPHGRIVLMGMPARVDVDLTGLWHRETELKGSYTYGTETLPDGSRRRTFELAIELAGAVQTERLLSATYPLEDYVRALRHAAEAGPRGAIKIAFDLRPELLKTDKSKKAENR